MKRFSIVLFLIAISHRIKASIVCPSSVEILESLTRLINCSYEIDGVEEVRWTKDGEFLIGTPYGIAEKDGYILFPDGALKIVNAKHSQTGLYSLSITPRRTTSILESDLINVIIQELVQVRCPKEIQITKGENGSITCDWKNKDDILYFTWIKNGTVITQSGANEYSGPGYTLSVNGDLSIVNARSSHDGLYILNIYSKSSSVQFASQATKVIVNDNNPTGLPDPGNGRKSDMKTNRNILVSIFVAVTVLIIFVGVLIYFFRRKGQNKIQLSYKMVSEDDGEGYYRFSHYVLPAYITRKSAPTRRIVRVMLVGMTGAGKSSTGNTLIGREAFDVVSESHAGTKVMTKATLDFDGTMIEFLDTPGILDPENKSLKLEELRRFDDFIGNNGIDVFVFVHDITHCDDAETAIVKAKNFFGPKFMDIAMVIFTHADEGESPLHDPTLEKILTDENYSKSLFVKVSNDFQQRVMKLENYPQLPQDEQITWKKDIAKYFYNIVDTILCDEPEKYTKADLPALGKRAGDGIIDPWDR